MELILIVITIIAVIVATVSLVSKSKVDAVIKEGNERLKEERLILNHEKEVLINDRNALLSEKQSIEAEMGVMREQRQKLVSESVILQNDISHKKKSLEDLNDTINTSLDNQTELSQKAFKNYCDTLDEQYQDCVEEYNYLIKTLQDAYTDMQLDLLRESDEIRSDLEKMRSTRSAAQEAFLKEKEIEKNQDDFRLKLEGRALGDIKILKSIQDQISTPIVIDKIIWSNYYQPVAKAKFPKIIGKADCCGIYKITSIISGEVYIGQSLTVCDRWKSHCKNALGVGTSTKGNKLYSAMSKYGLDNFTFEVLEECPPAQLDEKEKYYISLYDSYNFGLNGTSGNN